MMTHTGIERRKTRPRGVYNRLSDHIYDRVEAERARDPQREETIDAFMQFSGEPREAAEEEIDHACERAAMRFGYSRHQTYGLIRESIELEIRRDDLEVFALLRRRG